MDRLVEVIRKLVDPSSRSDAVLWALAIFIVLAAAVLRQIRSSKRPWLTKSLLGLFVTLAAPAVYYESVLHVRPWLLGFDAEKAGIVVARFYGAPTDQYFGDQGVSGEIASAINRRLGNLGIDSVAEAVAISWIVHSDDEASDFRSRYHAASLVWGHVVALHNALRITLNVENQAWGYTLTTPDSVAQSIEFHISRIGEYNVGLSDSTFQLHSLANQVAADVIPYLLVLAYGKHPELVVRLTDSLPSLDGEVVNNPASAFLLMSSAYQLRKLGRTGEAKDRFLLAFEYFCRIKAGEMKFPAGQEPSEGELRRFAGSALFQVAFCDAVVGEHGSALLSYLLTVKVDPTMKELCDKQIRKICYSLGIDSIQALNLPLPPNPFWH